MKINWSQENKDIKLTSWNTVLIGKFWNEINKVSQLIMSWIRENLNHKNRSGIGSVIFCNLSNQLTRTS